MARTPELQTPQPELTPAKEVSWQDLVAAIDVFHNDLAIVNHTSHQRRLPTETPIPEQYYLTINFRLIQEFGEEGFNRLLQASPISIGIQCMDARGAVGTHDAIQEMLMNDQAFQAAGGKVLFLSMAGGAVQQDEIIRDGKPVSANRLTALKTILRYIHEKAHSINQVVATCHDQQCGACKFFADDRPVHEQVDADKGSVQEQQEMIRRAHQCIAAVLPPELLGRTQLLLAAFGQDPDEQGSYFRALVPQAELTA